MFQVKVWVPGGDMAVVFDFASTLIESAANPPGNLGRGVLFFSVPFAFVSSLSPRIGAGLAGSDSASEVRGPLDRQVLVRQKRFSVLTISGVGPQNFIHKVGQEKKAASPAAQLGFPEIYCGQKKAQGLEGVVPRHDPLESSFETRHCYFEFL
jgi:hypothetical protein